MCARLWKRSESRRQATALGAFFGKESSRTANRVTFDVARTKLVLEKAPAGEAPRVHHFTLRVAGLNRNDFDCMRFQIEK